MSRCDPEHHCITCGDDGVAMRVSRVDANRLATCVDEEGSLHTVDVELIADVAPGDSVLVHAGVALARLATEAVA